MQGLGRGCGADYDGQWCKRMVLQSYPTHNPVPYSYGDWLQGWSTGQGVPASLGLGAMGEVRGPVGGGQTLGSLFRTSMGGRFGYGVTGPLSLLGRRVTGQRCRNAN